MDWAEGGMGLGGGLFVLCLDLDYFWVNNNKGPVGINLNNDQFCNFDKFKGLSLPLSQTTFKD